MTMFARGRMLSALSSRNQSLDNPGTTVKLAESRGFRRCAMKVQCRPGDAARFAPAYAPDGSISV
jgi:hypothetical protein